MRQLLFPNRLISLTPSGSRGRRGISQSRPRNRDPLPLMDGADPVAGSGPCWVRTEVAHPSGRSRGIRARRAGEGFIISHRRPLVANSQSPINPTKHSRRHASPPLALAPHLHDRWGRASGPTCQVKPEHVSWPLNGTVGTSSPAILHVPKLTVGPDG